MRRLRARRCGLIPPRSPLARYSVLLVDDQPEFLQIAQAVLADHPDIAVLGTAGSGEEAIGMVSDLEPDVVVLDVQMPGMSGFEVARRLTTSSPSVRIVLVSTDGEPLYEEFARSAGATAFLTKKQFLGEGLSEILG